MWDYKRWKNTYNFKQYDYNLIDDIYHNIKKNSRVIFIVRHAERWPDYWENWWLIKNWIRQSKSLWKRLSGWIFSDTTQDMYCGTMYKRTPETSFYVWYWRWYSSFKKEKKLFEQDRKKYEKIIKSIDVVDPYYLLYEMWFEELNKKSTHIANKLCKITKWHPFCFITSHDHLVIPLITWVSEWLIKFTLKTWINYLSWIAIIINDNNKTWEVYPIQTLKEKSIILDDPGDFEWVLCSNKKNR